MTKFEFSFMGSIMILFWVMFFKKLGYKLNPPPHDIPPDDEQIGKLKGWHYALLVLSFITLYSISDLFV